MAVKKILIVDDEEEIVKAITRVLESKRYQAIPAYNGKEGLKKARAEKPDLVLLDIKMPEMSGHQVLKEMRKDEELKAIPVIMLTVKDEAEDVVESMVEGGAIDYIVKPFVSQSLLEKIQVDIENVRKYEYRVLGDKIESEIKKIEGNKRK